MKDKHNLSATDMLLWNRCSNEKYTKKEHKSTNPNATDIFAWNNDREKYNKQQHFDPNDTELLWWNEKYTKEEHLAVNPSNIEMSQWNKDNKEKYTKEEHNIPRQGKVWTWEDIGISE